MDFESVPRNLNNYFYTKCIWAIAFCNDVDSMVENIFCATKIDVDSMCNMLNIFFSYNRDFLDNDSKKNLSYFVDYLGKLCNDAGLSSRYHSSIDRCGDSFIKGFVLTDYEIRYMIDDVPSYITDDENFDRYFKMLKIMYVDDLEILISHLYSDDNSFNESIEYYIDDCLSYVGSINKIFNDVPSIMKNDLFFSRFNCVCNSLDNAFNKNINDLSNNKSLVKVYSSFKDKISGEIK